MIVIVHIEITIVLLHIGKDVEIQVLWGYQMKKFISFVLTMIMALGLSCTAFAEDYSVREKQVNQSAEKTVSVEVSPSIQPRDTLTYPEFTGTITSGSKTPNFTVIANRNLKITIKTTADCHVWLYKGNVPVDIDGDNVPEALEIKANDPARSYLLRSNCEAGVYHLEFYSDTQQFFASYVISQTQYT